MPACSAGVQALGPRRCRGASRPLGSLDAACDSPAREAKKQRRLGLQLSGRREEFAMSLRVIDEIISIAVEVKRVVAEVRAHNRELSAQLERAWCRVATNAGEGQLRRGAKGCNRFDDALGEAREAHVALRYAQACGYARVDAELLRRVDGVAAVLYTLTRGRRKR